MVVTGGVAMASGWGGRKGVYLYPVSVKGLGKCIFLASLQVKEERQRRFRLGG